MAITKIYVRGNYLRLEIDGSTRILEDSKACVNVQESSTTADNWIIQSDKLGKLEIPFLDIRDEFDVAYSANDWEIFYTTNTGFDPASGSGATIFLDRADVQFDPVVNLSTVAETKMAFDLSTLTKRGTSFDFTVDSVVVNKVTDADVHVIMFFSSDNTAATNGNVQARRISDNAILANTTFSLAPRKSAAIRSTSAVIVSLGATFLAESAEIFVTVDETSVDLDQGTFQLTAVEFTF